MRCSPTTTSSCPGAASPTSCAPSNTGTSAASAGSRSTCSASASRPRPEPPHERTKGETNNMKILVTGNCGYIGPSVLRRLRQSYPRATLIGLDKGYFAHCLTNADILPECRADVQYFADVRRFPAELLRGVDALAHLAAPSARSCVLARRRADAGRGGGPAPPRPAPPPRSRTIRWARRSRKSPTTST